MAIPTPTIPSSITSVSAVRLNPTLSNKQFYINSGLIAANNTETTVISVADVGKRDILICINPILTTSSTDDMTMKLKNNGAIIYQMIITTQNFANTSSPLHFIIPASTNLEVTFTNADSTSHNVGISAYGYYLENNY
jgi:hypothetical protein